MKTKNIDIKNITKKEIDYVIKKLLEKMNFEIISFEEFKEGDEFNVIYKNPVVGGKYIVLLKDTDSFVGESTIKSLYRKVEEENYTKGIIITNSTFTNKARRYADKIRIELIDCEKLKELLDLNKINIIEEIKVYKRSLLEGYVEEQEDRENREKIFVDCATEDDEIKKIRRLIRENRRGRSIETLELRIEVVKWLIVKFDKLISLTKRTNVMNEIVENYEFILENPFIIDDDLEYKEDKKDLKSKIKLIHDSIDIRKGEFSEILSRNIEISKTMGLVGIKKLEMELYKIINIIRILELCNEDKRVEELISIIDEKINSDLNEKEIALRETDFEIRKTQSEFEKFTNMLNNELDEKLGIIHYKSLELFNEVIEKQLKDIELLNKEIASPGYIKSFNLFSKRKEEEELKELLNEIEAQINKSELYKQKIIESYAIGENKFLIEYKENVLMEIFNKILECKIEKEINKNNYSNFNKNLRSLCWDSIDYIISKFNVIDEIDENLLSSINIKKIQYSNELILMVKQTTESANVYMNELENLSENLKNQIKYLNNILEWFQKDLLKNNIYLYDFNSFSTDSNITKDFYYEIEVDDFIKTIDRELIKEEIKKIKALMGIYRFK